MCQTQRPVKRFLFLLRRLLKQVQRGQECEKSTCHANHSIHNSFQDSWCETEVLALKHERVEIKNIRTSEIYLTGKQSKDATMPPHKRKRKTDKAVEICPPMMHCTCCETLQTMPCSCRGCEKKAHCAYHRNLAAG